PSFQLPLQSWSSPPPREAVEPIFEFLGPPQRTSSFRQISISGGDFKGATSPDKADFKGGAQAKFWWRAHEKRGGTLAGEKELVHRSVKGRSLVWFLPLGSSSLWQFELDKAHREDFQLKALLKKLANEGYSGYSFRAVHPILPFVCL
ncbi:hypothetical protein EI94DRAFT_1747174, partial [Lactarius quietus]